MGRAIGIDLGTTFSAVSFVTSTGRPEILVNRDGERLTPSVVFFDTESVLVGSMAKRSAAFAPLDVVQFVKRHMGNQDWKYETTTGVQYGAEEISALILKRLKDDAQSALGDGDPITDAVITVPAFFDDARRRATRDAGKIAGLNVLRIINEPTAAALAYGLLHHGQGTVLVYDLGGGTFDVTLLRIDGTEFDVVSTDGLHELGGFEWDNRLMEWINEEFQRAGGPDLTETFEAEADLREKAELAKHRLSHDATARVVLSRDGVTQSIVVTREVFEERTADLLNQSRDLTICLVEEAGLTFDDISGVLMVGGSTRMPMVGKMLAATIGRQPLQVGNPDELVALGAAIQANMCDDGLTPDAQGPAITDVSSHALGVIALNDHGRPRNNVIIPRNSKIPCSGTGFFQTIEDDQTAVKVHVTQGDDEDPGYVRQVTRGRYPTGGQALTIPAYKAGAPIQITFHYDIDCTIQVEVTDLTSSRSLGTFEIDNVGSLSDEELARAIEKNRQLGVE